jgi:hypothetical protein
MTALLTATERTTNHPAKLSTLNATDVYHNNFTDGLARKGIGGTVCNASGSAATVTMTWNKASTGVDYAILSVYSIAARTTLDLAPYIAGLRLAGTKEGTGDKLIFTAGTVDTLEIVVIVAEPGGPMNRPEKQ